MQCSHTSSVPAGGIFIRRSNYSLDGVMFTANAAGLGGGLFVAANLSTNASMRNLVFANDDRAIRGVGAHRTAGLLTAIVQCVLDVPELAAVIVTQLPAPSCYSVFSCGRTQHLLAAQCDIGISSTRVHELHAPEPGARGQCHRGRQGGVSAGKGQAAADWRQDQHCCGRGIQCLIPPMLTGGSAVECTASRHASCSCI
jgi:hypothetical protein